MRNSTLFFFYVFLGETLSQTHTRKHAKHNFVASWMPYLNLENVRCIQLTCLFSKKSQFLILFSSTSVVYDKRKKILALLKLINISCWRNNKKIFPKSLKKLVSIAYCHINLIRTYVRIRSIQQACPTFQQEGRGTSTVGKQ